MNRFIEENTVFIASTIALAVLIAGASMLSQQGTIVYDAQSNTVPTSSSTTAANTPNISATSSAGSDLQTSAQPIQPAATTVAPTSSAPAIKPSIRYRGDDEGSYDDN